MTDDVTVIGDTIYWRGHAVAVIVDTWPTLRANFIEALVEGDRALRTSGYPDDDEDARG